MGFKESIACINTGIATAIFITCIATFAIGCQPRYRPVDNERLTDYLVNRDLANIIQQVKNRAKEEYKLLPSNCFGGTKKNPIARIKCSFEAIDLHLDQTEARIFMITVVNNLINAINSYPSSEKILDEFPFPTRKFELTIFFVDKSRTDSVPDPFIGGIELKQDQLAYLKYNRAENKYEEILEESLEAARQKIALSQPNN